MAAYVVIRVLGQADVNYNIQHTMHLLGLNRVNHATVVPVNDAYKGMLQVEGLLHLRSDRRGNPRRHDQGPR